jgi:hypothetical protein
VNYKDKAAEVIETIIDSTNIYEYIMWQMKENRNKDFEVCCFKDIKDDNGVQKRKRSIAVRPNIGTYQCQYCGSKGTILDWHINYFDASFTSAIQCLNLYYCLDLLEELSQKEIEKVSKYAKKYNDYLLANDNPLIICFD